MQEAKLTKSYWMRTFVGVGLSRLHSKRPPLRAPYSDLKSSKQIWENRRVSERKAWKEGLTWVGAIREGWRSSDGRRTVAIRAATGQGEGRRGDNSENGSHISTDCRDGAWECPRTDYWVIWSTGMERGKKSRREADNSAVAGHGLMGPRLNGFVNLLLYLSNEQSLLFI